jgi:ATP-binding cassette subfamily B protein
VSTNTFQEEEFETTSKLDGKTLVRILTLTKPHWKYLAGFLTAIAVVSGLDSYFTFLSKRIIDEGIIAQNAGILKTILTQYGALIVVQALGVFGFIYMVGVLGEQIRYDLRKNMFTRLQELSLAYYSKTPVGWIMSRVTSDTERVADLVTWGVLDVTWGIINIITAMVFMLIINWKLALAVFIMLPIMFYVSIEFRKRILGQYRTVRKLNSRITGDFNENITGVRVVKALVREKGNLNEFGNLTTDMYHASFKAAWLSALFLPIVQIISSFALGSVVLFSGIQIENGLLTIGGIQAFVSYITFMMWPIQDLARVFAEMQHAVASAERIFSLIDAVPDVKDRPNAFDPGTIRGDIEFKNVDFSYEDGETVLHEFNLKVKRGETIALVGPTGGGKTTIVNLICRFYEPSNGVITIGDTDYSEYELRAIQSRIGVVLQTPHLFSGTIMENIRYGRLDAIDEEIIEASKLSGAHEFITKFSKGYQEEVGEGGNNLSVGQKQLISIARAILAKPEIFIMDEATSSVDTLTEALIQKGTDLLMEDRTSFVIAHRLSTIKRADRILVIEDGHISEMGTHTELLKLRGKYYNLYTKQFRSQMQHSFEDLPKIETTAPVTVK